MTSPAIPPALRFWRSFYAGAAVLASLLLQSQCLVWYFISGLLEVRISKRQNLTFVLLN